MNKAAAKQTTTKRGETPTPSVDGKFIALQFLDTGWRVTIPIVLFSYIGIQMDKRIRTSPLYTLIGLFLSLLLATWLVYRQIKSAYPDFFKKGKT